MASTSIMEDIRSLLSQGKSAAAVIALGYKPPTVYKVRRQMQKQSEQGSTPVQAGSDAATEPALLETPVETTELPQQVADLEADLAEAQLRVVELESEAADIDTLTEYVAIIQEEAQSWQHKAEEAQRERDDAQRQLEEARKEIQSLRQLLMWEGHPCCVCEEPMSGALVDRETAARALSHAGHRGCLERQGLVKTTWHLGSVSIQVVEVSWMPWASNTVRL